MRLPQKDKIKQSAYSGDGPWRRPFIAEAETELVMRPLLVAGLVMLPYTKIPKKASLHNTEFCVKFGFRTHSCSHMKRTYLL